MRGTPLGWPDVAAIVLIAWPAIGGLFRGFAWQAVRLAGWILALVIARSVAPPLASRLRETLSVSAWTAGALSWFLVFATVVALATAAAHLSRELLSRARLGSYDRLLGMAFGAAKGALVAGLLLVLVARFAPAGPLGDAVRSSRTLRLYEKLLAGNPNLLPWASAPRSGEPPAGSGR